MTIDGARGILFNITGSPDMTLFEINEAAAIIKDSAHPDVNLIFGAQVDESMGDEIKITVTMLKKQCKDLGIKNYSRMTKPELLDALQNPQPQEETETQEEETEPLETATQEEEKKSFLV